jgi:hypothetical protein
MIRSLYTGNRHRHRRPSRVGNGRNRAEYRDCSVRMSRIGLLFGSARLDLRIIRLGSVRFGSQLRLFGDLCNTQITVLSVSDIDLCVTKCNLMVNLFGSVRSKMSLFGIGSVRLIHQKKLFGVGSARLFGICSAFVRPVSNPG